MDKNKIFKLKNEYENIKREYYKELQPWHDRAKEIAIEFSNYGKSYLDLESGLKINKFSYNKYENTIEITLENIDSNLDINILNNAIGICICDIFDGSVICSAVIKIDDFTSDNWKAIINAKLNRAI